jgi:hypothetical protein
MIVLRVIAGCVCAVLLAAIAWAVVQSGELHGSIFDQFGVLMTLPWGVTTLIDLYGGFALLAVIIFLAEKSFLNAALWSAPMFFLGNVWAALWLVFRAGSLARRLNRPDPG